MKRLLALGAVLFTAAAIAWAADRVGYRIELVNGGAIRAVGAPVTRGSIVVFHRYPDGALSGVPSEEVTRIEPVERVGAVRVLERDLGIVSADTFPPATSRPLRPGEAVDVGVTGASPPPAAVVAPAAPSAPIPGGVYDARMPFYGGGTNPSAANALAASNAAAAAAAAASAASPFSPTIASDGFPAPATTTVVGSNGMFAFSSVPGSATVVIGPDGTPEMANPGTPGATMPVIGPNGTPVLGTDATSPLVIGSNGTPVLAPSGGPGSVSPTIGSNGMPVLAPSSVPPTIGSNGMPVLAPGAAPAPSVGPNGFPVLAAPAPATAAAATPHR